jgi:hypothetical protein
MVIAKLNNEPSVRKDLGAVFILGFVSCSAFLLGCIFMYKKVAHIANGQAVLGAFLIAPIIGAILHIMLNSIYDLNYLSQPKYNELFWMYGLMNYFISNIITLLILLAIQRRVQKRKDFIDRLTGRKN